MKFLTGIILLALLNTACGGLKHQKTQGGAAAKPSTKNENVPQNIKTLQNLIQQNESFEINGETRYTVIAKFKRTDLGTLALNTSGNAIKLGTMKVERHISKYLPAYEGTSIEPELSKNSEDHPEISAYLLQSDPASNLVSIGVSTDLYTQNFKKITDHTDVKCNHIPTCSELTIVDHFDDSGVPFQGNYTLSWSGFTFTCEDFGICNSHNLNGGRVSYYNYEDLKQNHKIICNQTSLLYSTKVQVENSANVGQYTVNLVETMKTEMAGFSFLPAGDQN